jgi:hypothetical protein
MPGTNQPVGHNGPIPAWWNAVLQTMQQMQADIKALQSGQQNTLITDSNGNATVIIGQLSQTVTIGAISGQAGVQVMTNLGDPSSGQQTAGLAFAQDVATGTITTTEGSFTATLDSTTTGTFTNGMVIGAADVSDPSSGTATPAIVPGTTFTISGSAITLNKAASESGTGIYCAACFWRLLSGLTYP